MNFFIGLTIFTAFFAAVIYFSIIFSVKYTGRYGYFLAILAVLSVFGIVMYVTLGPFKLYSDALYYHQGGVAILEWWNNSGPNPYDGFWQSLMDKRAWPTVIASIYYLVGIEPLAVIALSILLLGLTAVFIASTVKKIFPEAKIGALFTIVFLVAPFIEIFGVSLGRESMYWFATSVMTYSLSIILKDKKYTGFLFFCVGALILVFIRPNLGIPQIYAFIIPIFIWWVCTSYPFRLRKILAFVFVGFVIGISVLPAKDLITANSLDIQSTRFYLSEGAESSFENDSSGENRTSVNQLLESESHPISAEVNSTSVNSFVDYGIYSLRSLPNGLLGPFLSEINLSPVMILSALNLFYWAAIVFFAILGIFLKWKRNIGIVFLSTSFLIIAIISTLLTNYGILIRFRAIAVIILLPYSYFVMDKILNYISAKRMQKSELNYITDALTNE